MPDPNPKDLTCEILESAVSPRSASGDSGSMESHSIPDQILADRYAKSQRAAKRGLGFRMVKIVPPGASNVDFDR